MTIYSCNLLPNNNELKAAEDRRNPERMQPKRQRYQNGWKLSVDKKSDLTKLNGELKERSTLANAQEIETIALKTQVEALKQALDGVGAELKTIKDYRTAEPIELKSANEALIKERGEFEAFRRRVAELVQQLTAQTAEEKIRAEDLENRLVEQSRLLNESAVELGHLRSEIEIACEAEADLRRSTIEIEGRANTAIQNLKSETAKLQAALDRANAERIRLAHELARSKRQAEETGAE